MRTDRSPEFADARVDLAVAEDGTVFVLHESAALAAAVAAFRYAPATRRLAAHAHDGRTLLAALVSPEIAAAVAAAGSAVFALMRGGVPHTGALVPLTLE